MFPWDVRTVSVGIWVFVGLTWILRGLIYAPRFEWRRAIHWGNVALGVLILGSWVGWWIALEFYPRTVQAAAAELTALAVWMLNVRILVPLLVLIAGVGLLCFVTVWAPRVGDEPRCRACRYNLTGLAAGRCPECGREITSARAVVRGVARRSRAGVAVGLALVVAPGLWLAGVAALSLTGPAMRGKLPTRAILLELRVSPNVDAGRELYTRWLQDALSAAEAGEFADIAIAMQEQDARSGSTGDWMQWLCNLDAAGVLSPSQHARFLAQIISRVDVSTPPKVLSGWRFPVRVRFQAAIPSGWFIASAIEYGDSSRITSNRSSSTPGARRESIGDAVIKQTGARALPCKLQFHVYNAAGAPVMTIARSLERSINVVDEPQAAFFEVVDAPELDERLAEQVTVSTRLQLRVLSVTVRRPVDVPSAYFEVVLRKGHEERVVALNGPEEAWGEILIDTNAVLVPADWSPPFDIVLRSTLRSAHAQMRPADPAGRVRVWTDELWFRNVVPGAQWNPSAQLRVDEVRRIGGDSPVWRRGDPEETPQ